MGTTCSKTDAVNEDSSSNVENGTKWSCMSACSGIDPAILDERNLRADAVDPVMYDLCRKSLQMTLQDEANASEQQSPEQEKASTHVGQYHLLYKHQKGSTETVDTIPTSSPYSTRLIVRKRAVAHAEEGTQGTHVYAIRYPPEDAVEPKRVSPTASSGSFQMQEQCPSNRGQKEAKKKTADTTQPVSLSEPTQQLVPTEALQDFFQPATIKKPLPRQTITEWVTVSEEHNIYVVDVGLRPSQCDKIVSVTEQVCRGQYAAYTYAKQTLGCREFPILAETCAPPVQTVVQAILGLPTKNSPNSQHLQLDDREPHLVKYDVTKKERQKLDMHTDKSEWTFLIALSNGCGCDYDGGGTFFECLNATVHVQRGHALIFPGRLRHCGQRITRGLRYLLVGFLVDKANVVSNQKDGNGSGSNTKGAIPATSKMLTASPGASSTIKSV